MKSSSPTPAPPPSSNPSSLVLWCREEGTLWEQGFCYVSFFFTMALKVYKLFTQVEIKPYRIALFLWLFSIPSSYKVRKTANVLKSSKKESLPFHLLTSTTLEQISGTQKGRSHEATHGVLLVGEPKPKNSQWPIRSKMENIKSQWDLIW